MFRGFILSFWKNLYQHFFQLAEPIPLGNGVSPVVLPTKDLIVTGESLPARLSGWGQSEVRNHIAPLVFIKIK